MLEPHITVSRSTLTFSECQTSWALWPAQCTSCLWRDPPTSRKSGQCWDAAAPSTCPPPPWSAASPSLTACDPAVGSGRITCQKVHSVMTTLKRPIPYQWLSFTAIKRVHTAYDEKISGSTVNDSQAINNEFPNIYNKDQLESRLGSSCWLKQTSVRRAADTVRASWKLILSSIGITV